MPIAHTQPVDLIAELRLRQWARANYVPAEIRRDSQWHPIVLDEMQRKDADLRAIKRAPVSAAAPVPHLDGAGAIRRIDNARESSPTPHFTSTPIPYYA